MLLNGVQLLFFRLRKVEPSNPPPQPAQCGKCFSFQHHADEVEKQNTSLEQALILLRNVTSPKLWSAQEITSLDQRCPNRPLAPISEKMTVKLRTIDGAGDFLKPTECTSCICLFSNYLRSTTMAFLRLLPNKREEVFSTTKVIAKRFERKLAVNFSNNKTHLTVFDSKMTFV